MDKRQSKNESLSTKIILYILAAALALQLFIRIIS